MSSSFDYGLIYKARPLQRAIIDRQHAAKAAEKGVKDAEHAWKHGVARLAGCQLNELEFTNIACLADGILEHVYKGYATRGAGRRNCIFCGADDFND